MKTIILFFGLLTSSISFAQRTEFFRQLRYNHVSPLIDIVGIHPIDSTAASKTSHYVFKYDEEGRTSEIINNHYHTEKVHPLASIGAYKVVFNYFENKEQRIFFSTNNERMTNDRGVYKEVYTLDNQGVKVSLEFYDLKDKPMESNWLVSKYTWKKTDELIIERRYDLSGQLVNLSPYFEFGITGIAFDKSGQPKGHYNLNEDLEITENEDGVASYQDTYDKTGNHIKYTYHNKTNDLVMNQWNYAIGRKEYDSLGNYVKLKLYDTEDKLFKIRRLYSNARVKLSQIAAEEDSLQIYNVSLGYLKALQELKPNLMDQVLNDSLNKITIGYDRETSKQYGRATTKAKMIEFAKDWNAKGTQFPFKPNNQIVILDIYNRIASVKLVSDNWVEYLQLIKLDDNWEIMNLLWQYRDIKRYGD